MGVHCSHGRGLTPVHVPSSQFSTRPTAGKALLAGSNYVSFGHVRGLTPDMAPGAGS